MIMKIGHFNIRPFLSLMVLVAFINRVAAGEESPYPEDSEAHLVLKDSAQPNEGIDWILYKGNVDVLSREKLNYNVNGFDPSDRKPVLAEFQFLGN
jgi:hypothetical protein